MSAINVIGWFIYAYLVVALIFSPEPPVKGRWRQLIWTASNLNWVFYVLLFIGLIFIGYTG